MLFVITLCDELRSGLLHNSIGNNPLRHKSTPTPVPSSIRHGAYGAVVVATVVEDPGHLGALLPGGSEIFADRARIDHRDA
jgi:hypothetical protein